MSQRNIRRAAGRQRQGTVPVPFLLVGGGLILLAVTAWLIFGGGEKGVPVTVSGAPSLSVDREQVDLGDVKLGRTVEVSFHVSNAGDQALRFLEKPYVEVVEGC